MGSGRNGPAKQAVKNVPTTIDLANGSIVAIESATVPAVGATRTTVGEARVEDDNTNYQA